jgi:hypothetical protein
MAPRSALLPAAIPVLALVCGLPLANRLEPLVFGLPFLLFWMLAWVLLTPAFLVLAYVLVHRAGPTPGAGRSASDRAGHGQGVRPGERP